MNIRCAQHRMLPWLGHGQCLSCGKTFKHIMEQEPNCSCGARLLPWGKLKVEGLFRALGKPETLTGFSGRPMCAKCFDSEAVAEIQT